MKNDDSIRIRLKGFPPGDLLQRLCDVLGAAPKSSLADRRVASLRRSVQAGKQPDYEKDWAAFSYLYFAANFAKTYNAVTHVVTPPTSVKSYRVLDLGCGAGASSAGILCALHRWLNQSNCQFDLTGVEANEKQSRLYQNVFQEWVNQFKAVKSELVMANALKFLATDKTKWDLIVVSYLFLELPLAQRHDLYAALESRQKETGAKIVIIDVSDNHEPIVKILSEHTPHVHRLKPPKSKYDLSALSPLNVAMRPMYGAFYTRPNNLLHLLEDYFSAWENHDTKLLKSIFHENATYNINGRTTLKGIDAIIDYWRENDLEQQNVLWQVKHCKLSGTKIQAEWMASFVRRDKGVYYQLDGSMELSIKSDKVFRLTEIFSKKIKPVTNYDGGTKAGTQLA